MVKPIWIFFIDRTVQNKVPLGEYGTYQALLSLSIIFQIILDFGITSYNSRVISQNPERLPQIFPSMFTARLLLSSAYFIIATTWGYAIGYRGIELQLLLGVLCIQALNSMLSFIRSNISALQRFKTDGVLSITDKLLMICICGILLLIPATSQNFKISWFISAQIGSYALTSIIAFVVLLKVSKAHIRLHFDKTMIANIIKSSLPYALLIFQMSVYNRADAMMIERLSTNGKLQADIWASAFRQLDVANILGLMFATMLLPLFGKMLASRDDVRPLIKLCTDILLPFSVIITVIGIVFSNDVMQLLYKGAHTSAAMEYKYVFAWLIGSFPAWCMMYIYSTLLTANGNLKTLNIIAFFGVVFNLTLNFILIPRYGSVGGAFTSCVTQSLLSILFIVACSKIFDVRFEGKWLLLQALFAIALTGVALTIAAQTPLSWIVKAAIVGFAGAVGMVLFGFVSPSSLKLLMAQKKQQQ